MQRDTGMAMMFITHDLGVVAEIADEVVVMYLGTVVEQGNVDEIFHDPQHPYTKALLASIPTMGRGVRQPLTSIRGQVPHPLDRPEGLSFPTALRQRGPGSVRHGRSADRRARRRRRVRVRPARSGPAPASHERQAASIGVEEA